MNPVGMGIQRGRRWCNWWGMHDINTRRAAWSSESCSCGKRDQTLSSWSKGRGEKRDGVVWAGLARLHLIGPLRSSLSAWHGLVR